MPYFCVQQAYIPLKHLLCLHHHTSLKNLIALPPSSSFSSSQVSFSINER